MRRVGREIGDLGEGLSAKLELDWIYEISEILGAGSLEIWKELEGALLGRSFGRSFGRSLGIHVRRVFLAWVIDDFVLRDKIHIDY